MGIAIGVVVRDGSRYLHLEPLAFLAWYQLLADRFSEHSLDVLLNKKTGLVLVSLWGV